MSSKRLHWFAKKLVYHDPMDKDGVIFLSYSTDIWHMRFGCYICFCGACGKWFYSVRPHAQTCTTKCRKAKSRMKPNQIRSVTLPERNNLVKAGLEYDR